LFWTGTWEKEIAELMAKRVAPNSIALDVGSHRAEVPTKVGAVH
jgi:hypothetical protein